MKLPRFTVRRMVVAATVIGVVVALGIEGERRRPYYSEAVYVHGSVASRLPTGDADRARHEGLRRRFEWAARLPWLPIWPDPRGSNWHRMD
jgi:hypothetical protein